MTELTRRVVLSSVGTVGADAAAPLTVPTPVACLCRLSPAGSQSYQGSKMTDLVFMPGRQRLASGTALELFVSPTGDDANNGWLPATAMRTPQRAVIPIDSSMISMAHRHWRDCHTAKMPS